MLRCYKCKIQISPADPNVAYDLNVEDYVHKECMGLTTKISKVKMHLLRGGQLTVQDAIKYWGYQRLSAGIEKLIRRHGLKIESEIQYDENDHSKHWSKYYIKPENHVSDHKPNRLKDQDQAIADQKGIPDNLQTQGEEVRIPCDCDGCDGRYCEWPDDRDQEDEVPQG
jgi:hypothetical protein